MTENEAIEELKLEGGLEITGRPIRVAKFFEGIDVAIKALEEIQKYRKIEKDLKENYHANVDIPLLMKHFIETVFKGEKHEGFCILTNEDKEAWEEYKVIGTPEECRAAVEKQTETLTVDKAKTIAAKAICIGCGYLADCKCDYNGGNCMVSKPMLESVLKSFDDWNRRVSDGKTN